MSRRAVIAFVEIQGQPEVNKMIRKMDLLGVCGPKSCKVGCKVEVATSYVCM